MLKVSQKLEYAMRAMIELAQRSDEDALIPAREIAERQQVPLRFLEQQLGALSKAGLVESFRGAGGGCRLARDPRTSRWPRSPTRSKARSTRCSAWNRPITPASRTRAAGCRASGPTWRARCRQVFDETTVADLAARHRTMSGPVLISPEQLLSRSELSPTLTAPSTPSPSRRPCP